MSVKKVTVTRKMFKEMKAKSRLIDRSAKVKFFRIVKVSPTKTHAWVETNFGVLRKPMGSIPADVREAYANQ